MSAEMARRLAMAVVERQNILVVGGTSSGKTTLANALLAEMGDLDERVILIEDTRELQCAASDVVALRTRTAGANAAGMVRSEEHTSELQSLMRISYAVFCLKKKTTE